MAPILFASCTVSQPAAARKIRSKPNFDIYLKLKISASRLAGTAVPLRVNQRQAASERLRDGLLHRTTSTTRYGARVDPSVSALTTAYTEKQTPSPMPAAVSAAWSRWPKPTESSHRRTSKPCSARFPGQCRCLMTANTRRACYRLTGAIVRPGIHAAGAHALQRVSVGQCGRGP